MFIEGLSREEVTNIKQRRRTLKNRGYAATVRVKREETKGELETKLNTVDCEEKKYRFANNKGMKGASPMRFSSRMEIAQLQSEIERIKKMADAIVRYASTQGIPVSQVGILSIAYLSNLTPSQDLWK